VSSIKTIATTDTFTQQAAVGSYFRILSASADKTVVVRFRNDDGSEDELELVAGLGVSKAQPYTSIMIRSDEPQSVRFYSGNDKVDDDRLAGNFDINAALNVAQTAPSKHEVHPLQNITGLTEVLAERATRKTALIQVNAPVYVGSNNGVQVEGLFTWENRAALSLVPVSGTVQVRINEDYD